MNLKEIGIVLISVIVIGIVLLLLFGSQITYFLEVIELILTIAGIVILSGAMFMLIFHIVNYVGKK